MHVLRGDKLGDERGLTHVTIADHTDTELKLFSFKMLFSVYFYLLTIVPRRKRTNARGIETVTNNWGPAEVNIEQTKMCQESPEYLGEAAPLGLAL